MDFFFSDLGLAGFLEAAASFVESAGGAGVVESDDMGII